MPAPTAALSRELANTAGFQVEQNLPPKRRRAKRNPFRPDPPRSPAPKSRTPETSPPKKSTTTKKSSETYGRVASGRVSKKTSPSSKTKAGSVPAKATKKPPKKIQTTVSVAETASDKNHPVEDGLVETSPNTPRSSRGRAVEVEAQHVLEIEKEAGVTLEIIRALIIDSAQVLYGCDDEFKIITTYDLGCFTAFLLQKPAGANPPSFTYKLCAHNAFGIKNAFAQLLAAMQIMLGEATKYGADSCKTINVC